MILLVGRSTIEEGHGLDPWRCAQWEKVGISDDLSIVTCKDPNSQAFLSPAI